MRTATGRLEVGDGQLGFNNAGINGSGSGASDIRFWGGATYANRDSAPFRVRQDGKIFATSGEVGGCTLFTDAIYLGTSPEYKKTSDGFAVEGLTLAANGSIHAARFYINSDGSIGIRSSASGKRIEIDSVNNRMDLYNSSGVNVLRLDDTIGSASTPGMRAIYPSSETSYNDYVHSQIAMYRSSDLKVQLYHDGSLGVFILKNLQAVGSGYVPLYIHPTTGEIRRGA